MPDMYWQLLLCNTTWLTPALLPKGAGPSGTCSGGVPASRHCQLCNHQPETGLGYMAVMHDVISYITSLYQLFCCCCCKHTMYNSCHNPTVQPHDVAHRVFCEGLRKVHCRCIWQPLVRSNLEEFSTITCLLVPSLCLHLQAANEETKQVISQTQGQREHLWQQMQQMREEFVATCAALENEACNALGQLRACIAAGLVSDAAGVADLGLDTDLH